MRKHSPSDSRLTVHGARFMVYVLGILALLLLTGTLQAQKVLTESEFIAAIRKYHPLAKSAALQVDIAKSGRLAARGAFDPTLRYNTARKDLEGIRYYDDANVELKIPTWYGIDVTAGTEAVSGDRVNPEETRGTISYVGVSVPIGRDLLFDKRRAALQQASVLVNASEAQRRSALNDLLREALEDYWTWWEHTRQLTLADSALANARQRMQLVRSAWRLGDRSAIDTLEALTQVQTFELQRNDVALKLAKARLELLPFLWRENNEAYELPADVVPQPNASMPAPLLDNLLANLRQHPDVQQYFYKQEAARIERRLKFQSLLPDVDLKYNQLVKSDNPLKSFNNAWFRNDFRFGVSVAVPLRLSEGRGSWRQAKQKLQQVELETINKQVQLQAKVKQYFTEWQVLSGQVNLQESAARNYAALQRGEETRFFNGESSLFVVNSREQKTWEALQKSIELQGKWRRSWVNLQWAAAVNVPQ